MNMFLAKLKDGVNMYIRRVKAKWIEYGCTVMSDAWMTQTHKAVIIFIIYYDGSMMFMYLICLFVELNDYITI